MTNPSLCDCYAFGMPHKRNAICTNMAIWVYNKLFSDVLELGYPIHPELLAMLDEASKNPLLEYENPRKDNSDGQRRKVFPDLPGVA